VSNAQNPVDRIASSAPRPFVCPLGGLASTGIILGMFVGATLLALGYQIFMWWVRYQS
jgi:hypothetical protein